MRELNPHNTSALVNLGVALQSDSEIWDAISIYDEVLALDPSMIRPLLIKPLRLKKRVMRMPRLIYISGF